MTYRILVLKTDGTYKELMSVGGDAETAVRCLISQRECSAIGECHCGDRFIVKSKSGTVERFEIVEHDLKHTQTGYMKANESEAKGDE